MTTDITDTTDTTDATASVSNREDAHQWTARVRHAAESLSA